MDKLLRELDISPFRETAFMAGHNACPGCGSTTALRQVAAALDDDIVFFVPASCGSLYFGPSATATASVPVVHTVFAAAFAEAEGFAYGLRQQGRSTKVVIWAGDGACYDIGFSGLSGAAARDANILVICNDNQGYQNTGGHESSATPQDTIMREGHDERFLLGSSRRKDLAELMATHGVPYVATICAAFPEDLERKVRKAMSIQGFRFLLLLTPCVTWGYDARLSVKLARLSVDTGYFPLYEVEHGERYRVTYEPPMTPLEEFANLQKRLKGAELTIAKREIEHKWADLRYKVARFAGQPAPADAPEYEPVAVA